MLRQIQRSSLLASLSLCACSGGESTVENNTASVVIDDVGGSVSLAGVTVAVPPDAVDEPTQVSISLIGNPPADLPTGRVYAGPIFMLTPHGQRFARDVVVTFPRQEGSSELWTLDSPDGDMWRLEAHVTLEEDKGILATTHFSYFAWLIATDVDGGTQDATSADAAGSDAGDVTDS